MPDPISLSLISMDITTNAGLACLGENELRISIGYTVMQKKKFQSAMIDRPDCS